MSDNQNMDYESVATPVRKKKKKKFTVSDGIRIGVITIAAGVFIFALIQLLNIKQGYEEGQEIYKDIQGQAVVDVTRPDSTDSKRLVSPSKDVDWERLFAIQPNTVGWVEVPACAINYPIVRGEDNDFYLDHAFNDEFSWSGAIFLDYRESLELTEERIVFYGHHMKDGSMFCDLLEYDNESFFKANEGKNYFFIYTPENIKVYQIFCVCDVNIDDHQKAYTIDINENFTIKDYAEYVNSYALYDTGVSIDDITQVATLFTCQTDSQSNVRHMVQGKLVETIEY